MAAVETKIYTTLTGNATVARLINTRIYPLILPQNPTLPAITYQRSSAAPENTLAGYSGLKNILMLINCWANTYSEAKALADAIHDALNAATTFKALLISESDAYEPDTRIYMVSQDYSCWSEE